MTTAPHYQIDATLFEFKGVLLGPPSLEVKTLRMALPAGRVVWVPIHLCRVTHRSEKMGAHFEDSIAIAAWWCRQQGLYPND